MKSNGLHSQKLLRSELNGLLILAHVFGVFRPCILEVRVTTDQMVWIGQEAARVKSPTKLKREFGKIFNVAPRDAFKLQCVQF